MSLKIIPQNFTFEKPTITDMSGKIVSAGIKVSVDIDILKADKTMVKDNLQAIFAQVLEYFDECY